MRAEYVRKGAAIFYHRYGGKAGGRPTCRGVITDIEKTETRGYVLTIVGEDGKTLKRNSKHVSLDRQAGHALARSRPIWVRRDVLGCRGQELYVRRSKRPLFMWRAPEGDQVRHYARIDIDVDHVSDLRTREEAVSEVEQELEELNAELFKYLEFLKNDGAAPPVELDDVMASGM